MPKLSALFRLEVSSPCRLEWPSDHSLSATTQRDNFHITARLDPRWSWAWTSTTGTIELELSRTEADALLTSDIHSYLWPILPDYQDTAQEIAEKILMFFRYELFTPLIAENWPKCLASPSWSYEGRPLISFNSIVLPQPPGEQLGSIKVTSDNIPTLLSYMENSTKQALGIELLSDAQNAWFAGSLRRSVLELAICAEVMVKRKFFSDSSPAGIAFDYLEDKGKVSVRVIDLIHDIARQAFGISYRDVDKDGYDSIDFLFRCRNKVAHRNDLSFVDNSGNKVNVDSLLVKKWWQAVKALKDWLQVLQSIK